jgi:hypothetical protein
LRELPDRVGEWMMRLEREGVHGADLVFACIGPASEISAAIRASKPPMAGRCHLPNTWKKSGR